MLNSFHRASSGCLKQRGLPLMVAQSPHLVKTVHLICHCEEGLGDEAISTYAAWGLLSLKASGRYRFPLLQRARSDRAQATWLSETIGVQL
jgi:hypothetical protein